MNSVEIGFLMIGFFLMITVPRDREGRGLDDGSENSGETNHIRPKDFYQLTAESYIPMQVPTQLAFFLDV